MTQFAPYTITCSCGNIVEMDVYESVNVTVDPRLEAVVKNRKINSYACSKCNAKSELAYKFLYVDLKKNIWVWCYPESEKTNKADIEKAIFDDLEKMILMLEKMGQPKPKLVFGYDDLIKEIDS